MTTNNVRPTNARRGLRTANRNGLSLLEMLACITIIGVLAAAIVPRLGAGGSIAKAKACNVNCETIQIQAVLWQREKGSWPASTLSTIGADINFFPEGVPKCPVDGSAYTIDSQGRVVGHAH